MLSLRGLSAWGRPFWFNAGPGKSSARRPRGRPTTQLTKLRAAPVLQAEVPPWVLTSVYKLKAPALATAAAMLLSDRHLTLQEADVV